MPLIKQNPVYCDDSTLGFGDDIYCRVTTQGGKNTITEFKPQEQSKCERVLNGTSNSDVAVILSSKDEACCNALGSIDVNKMELEWYGFGEKNLIWAGPITSLDWSIDSVVVNASDNTIWWSARDCDYYSENKELSDIILDLHNMVMRQEPINGFSIHKSPVSRSMELEVFSQENTKISDVISEILAVGIDYTVLNRNVIVGDADLFVSNSSSGYMQTSRTTPFRLEDADMYTAPVISANGIGTGFATRVVARGKNDKKVTITAPYSVIERYGLVSTNIEFPNISSEKALYNAAKSWLTRHSNPYIINETHTSALRPGSPIPHRALIPGIPILVESISTCKKFRTLMRLSKVTTFGSGRVEVSLEPMGEVLEAEVTGTSNSNG